VGTLETFLTKREYDFLMFEVIWVIDQVGVAQGFRPR
jgi:hypothetical protein